MGCQEAEGPALSLHEYLLVQALEKALHLPCPPTSAHRPLPHTPETIWGKGSDARSFFMASWPRSQRAEDGVVWAGFLSLPLRAFSS